MKSRKMKKLVSVAFTFCAAALYAELPDPLVWFKMDSVSGTTVPDASGNKRNLSLTGGIRLVDDAEFGKVLEFSGGANDRGNFTCPALTARTISCWFWRDRTDSDELTGNYPYLYMDISGVGVNWGKNGNGISYTQSSQNINGIDISRGSWHHLALVVTDKGNNTAGVSIYQDGVLAKSGDKTVTWASKASAGIIGNNWNPYGRPLKGRMCDFRVYDQVLSGAQINELVADGMAKREPCLISRWPFDVVNDEGGTKTTPEVTGRGTKMTLGSGMSLTDDAIDGKALRFYSATAAGIGASSSVPLPLYGYTWTCWVRRSSRSVELNAVSANPYPRFIVMGNGTYVQFPGSTAPAGRTVAVNASRQSTSTVTTSSDYGVAQADTWCHLAFVCRADSMVEGSRTGIVDVYADGEPVATYAKHNSFVYSDVFIAANDTLILGNTGIGNNRYFCGDMDDLRLYDGALSAAQVRSVYRGLATVSAGADATVKGTKAWLCGSVGANAGGLRTGFAGSYAWTLVSAPAGGEGATIETPQGTISRVSLPVEGAYTFRLTISNLGEEKHDDVVITRNDAAGTVPVTPTITPEDKDASVRASLKTDLGYVWRLEGADAVTVAGTANFTDAQYVSGKVGLGVKAVGHKAYFDTKKTAFPGEEGGTANTASTWPFVTVSAWVYTDSANTTNRWFGAQVVGKKETFGLRYQEKTEGIHNTRQQGYTIYQQGVGGTRTLVHYPAPAVSPEGCWLHLCAVVDRKNGTAMELWYDGVKQTETSHTGGSAGRYNANPIVIAGMPYAEVQNNSHDNRWNNYNAYLPTAKPYSAVTPSQNYSRAFPGIVDEVRIWKRKLSAEEIQCLAKYPDLESNAGPSATIEVEGKTWVRQPKEVVSVAFSDRLPETGKLVYEWRVISENANQVSIADATAASTEMTFAKDGVYTLQLKVFDGERTFYSIPKDIVVNRPGFTLFVR